MAPPHTMKYKDEPEIPMTMNPPLSTIINSAKAKPAASPTTLTPGMEALKPTTTPLFDLDTQIIDSTLPSTPMPAARRSYKQLSPRLSPQLNYMIANDLKETWSTKGPRGKAILLFFSLASSESEISAAKNVDESISKVKHANEMLAQSDSESGRGGNIKDDNHHLVVMLIDANKDFSKWVENYRRLVAEGGDKFKGADVWWEEVREIEGLVGEWEAVFPDGAWEVPFEKLGAVDDQIAAEYGEVRPQVLESLGEKKKKKKRSRRRKKGGKNADRGRSSGCESSADESEGAKDGVGKKKTGVKRLAEELETKGTNWSDASVDGSNESMEYISPFKVVTKKDPKEEVYKRMENFALEDEEDETERRDAKPDSSSSPPQLVDLSFSPSRRAAKSPGSTLPLSSSPKSAKPRRPVSPIQGTTTPAQSLAVAAIPSTSFDFAFGPPLPAAKPSQPLSPAQATPTPAPSVAMPISKLFGANFIPLDTTTKSSRPSSHVPHTPTPAQPAQVVPPVLTFGAKSTISNSASPLTSVETIRPAPVVSLPFTSGAANTTSQPSRPSTPVQNTPKSGQTAPLVANFGTANATSKSPRALTPPQAKLTPVQSMAPLKLPSEKFEFKFGSVIAVTSSALPSNPPESSKSDNFEKHGDAKATSTAVVTPQAFTTSASSTKEQKGEDAKAIICPAPNSVAKSSSQSIFSLRPSTLTSTPPVGPILQSSIPFKTAQKEARSFANKPPTASTLIELTRTTQSIQAGVNNLQLALHGFDTTTQAPQTAMNTGLLKMNNFIGELVTDIRIQTKALDSKVNEIGALVEGLGRELTKLRDENSLLTTEAAAKEKRDADTLNDMKEMMTQQMKDMKEMREHQQSGFTAMVLQNAKLAQEVAALKQMKSMDEAEICALKADNESFRKLVERLAVKVEAAIDRQLASDENGDEASKDEDALMQILWPQGDGRLDMEGVRKCGGEEVLERGVLAHTPGLRVPKTELGEQGKRGRGWCSVM
ncbi:hypothetical protein V8E51_012092 [Hyaloscypha variabilis]